MEDLDKHNEIPSWLICFALALDSLLQKKNRLFYPAFILRYKRLDLSRSQGLTTFVTYWSNIF